MSSRIGFIFAYTVYYLDLPCISCILFSRHKVTDVYADPSFPRQCLSCL
jgi:hypothetical protein